ncbi:MAG: preprotein translocase subunit SecA [Candidatus Pelagibacter sp.]|nr:preprotein translocase subunit SecA [Candidatus Pelagibacter sp.]|tara:strand:- start:462 stop:2999 length:2538 start_codon:yes stop_codon:yes gene_type:complete
MNFITTALNKLFKSTNQQELNKIRPIVVKINDLEKEFSNFKESNFFEKTAGLKKNLLEGRNIDEILPEAFALVREAAKQTLNERHFDEQIIGGVILHRGNIAEMKTGEGKTLVSTLPAYLNALRGEGVHIVTVNDYLAKRDSEWMGKIYNRLGLKTGCITNELDDIERKKNYNLDITYATNNELGFDYLRDNMKYDLSEMVQKNRNFCIVDEVDSILIDESRTPLIISGGIEDKSDQYFLANKFVSVLEKKDFELDEKNKNAILSDLGIDKVEKMSKESGLLKNDNFYDPENMNLVHHINQALRANFLFQKDKDYIVKEEKIRIIDEFTGRVLEGRRFGDGLHQAIEAKENVPIQKENQTLASITYQNYFRLYKKLSGMTGTALTESEEFHNIYKLNVVSIPTHKKMIRKDLNDQIFRTEKEKNSAILKKIKECSLKGQPVLVGTTSIEKSEKLSEIFKKNKISHNVLNAKHHESEANIIAEAGKSNTITIATNMAGRGTDIQLGGNKNLEKIENIKIDKQKVLSLGGLCIVGTERHESRRIDNQLRGRSGRQGDPGSSVFYISLEDDLMRIFGGQSIDGMLKKLGLKQNESINHPWINKAMERAQQKVEARNFEIRKTLLKFDDVMNDQRQVIFSQRLKILQTGEVKDMIYSFMNEINKNIENALENYKNSNNLKLFSNEIKTNFGNAFQQEQVENFAKMSKKTLLENIKKTFEEKRNERIKVLGKDQNNEVEKRIFLQMLDFLWRSHLQYLEQLRQVIGLRSYGQKDPLAEFRKEAFELFEGLLFKVKADTIKFLMNLKVVVEEKENNELKTVPIERKQKISRNAPCSCGSGKKYKHCHGKVA